jgi:hypothetical protein
MKNLIYFLSIVLFTACSRWIAPPYSNVEKLSGIRTGMSLPEVNNTLGIEPYDIYFKGNNDYIVIYSYRVKDRLMVMSGDFNNTIHSDISQNNGKDWYGDNYFCYVYFKNNKVRSLITDAGKLNSEEILIKNNNLLLIQKKKLGFYQKNDSTIFVPLK